MRTYSINGVGKTGYPLGGKRKVDLWISGCTKLISKWIKDFNFKLQILKFLENGREIFPGFSYRQELSEWIPMAQQESPIIYKKITSNSKDFVH